MKRPRIIIESRDEVGADALASALTAVGLDPIVCRGPSGTHGGCPVLDGARCALLDRADAVVYDLDLDRPEDRVVLKTLVIEHEGLPIITERSTEEVRRHTEALRPCTVVVPFSPDHLARTVAGVVADARRPLPL